MFKKPEIKEETIEEQVDETLLEVHDYIGKKLQKKQRTVSRYWFVIPLLMCVILATVLPVALCKSHNGGDTPVPPPPAPWEDTVEIDQQTENNYAKARDVYGGGSSPVISGLFCIDLRDLIVAGEEEHYFEIDQMMTCSIFVPSDLNVWIKCTTGGKISLTDSGKNLYGIVVGDEVANQGKQKGSTHLLNNTINISGGKRAYGIYFANGLDENAFIEEEGNYVTCISTDGSDANNYVTGSYIKGGEGYIKIGDNVFIEKSARHATGISISEGGYVDIVENVLMSKSGFVGRGITIDSGDDGIISGKVQKNIIVVASLTTGTGIRGSYTGTRGEMEISNNVISCYFEGSGDNTNKEWGIEWIDVTNTPCEIKNNVITCQSDTNKKVEGINMKGGVTDLESNIVSIKGTAGNIGYSSWNGTPVATTDGLNKFYGVTGITYVSFNGPNKAQVINNGTNGDGEVVNEFYRTCAYTDSITGDLFQVRYPGQITGGAALNIPKDAIAAIINGNLADSKCLQADVVYNTLLSGM